MTHTRFAPTLDRLEPRAAPSFVVLHPPGPLTSDVSKPLGISPFTLDPSAPVLAPTT